jgi:hypothetical protein
MEASSGRLGGAVWRLKPHSCGRNPWERSGPTRRMSPPQDDRLTATRSRPGHSLCRRNIRRSCPKGPEHSGRDLSQARGARGPALAEALIQHVHGAFADFVDRPDIPAEVMMSRRI